MPPPAGGRASKRRAAVWCVGGCQGRHAVGDGTSPAPLTHSQRSSLVQPRGTTAPSPPPPAPRRRVPAGGGADQRHHAVRQRSRRGRVTSSAAAAAAAAAAAVRSKALSTCTVRHARWHARTRGGPGMRARETQRAQARCVAVAGSLPPPPPPPRAVTATTHRARPVAGGHESSRGWFGLAPGARLAPATVRHSLAFRKQRPIGASPPPPPRPSLRTFHPPSLSLERSAQFHPSFQRVQHAALLAAPCRPSSRAFRSDPWPGADQ